MCSIPWMVPVNFQNRVPGDKLFNCYSKQTVRLPPDCVQILECYLLIFKTEYREKRKEQDLKRILATVS